MLTVIPLLAVLSTPILSEIQLHKILNSFFRSWFPHKDESKLLKAVLLKNSRQAIIFLSDPSIIPFLIVSSKEIIIAEPLTARFYVANKIPTECFTINTNHSEDSYLIYQNIEKLSSQALCNFKAVFLRKEEALIVLSARLEESINYFYESLENSKHSDKIHRVLVGDHRCVEFYWNGPVSVIDANSRLERSGQNLLSLIRGAIALWEEQPFILSVQIPSGDHLLSSPNLVIICCTERDELLLRKACAIHLNELYFLSISPEPEESSKFLKFFYNVQQPSEKDLDDHDHVDDDSRDTVSSMQMMTKANLECYILWDLDSCTLLDEDNAPLIIHKIYDQFFSVFDINNTGITPLAKLGFLCHEKNENSKPNDQQSVDLHKLDFKLFSFASKISKENSIKNEIEYIISNHIFEKNKPAIIIISSEEDLISSLASLKLEGYAKVLLVHKIDAEKDLLSLAPKRINWEDIKAIEKSNTTSALKSNSDQVSYDSSINLVTSENNYLNSVKLHVNKYITALHIKNLYEWEKLGETTLPEDYELVFNIGIKKKNQYISIISKYAIIASKVSDVLINKMALVNSKLQQKVLHSWKLQHREAILKSDLLIETEKSMETTALFYKINEKVTIDLISVDESNIYKFLKFINLLDPHEKVIISESTFDLKELDLLNVRKLYAFQVESIEDKKNKKSMKLKIWGFKYQGLLNKGEKALKEKLGIIHEQSGIQIMSESDKIFDSRGKNQSFGDLNDKITNQVIFKFKTREAGIFYQTYENVCKTYVEDIAQVKINRLDPNKYRNSDISIQTTVIMSGTTENLTIAKEYFKRFQTILAHSRIFSPKVSMEKYKQLHQMKLIFEKFSGYGKDPMTESTIISFRLKPPMHLKGVNRMIFPTDVWITICGPDPNYIKEIESMLNNLSSDFVIKKIITLKSNPINETFKDCDKRRKLCDKLHLQGSRLNVFENEKFNELMLWGPKESFENEKVRSITCQSIFSPEDNDSMQVNPNYEDEKTEFGLTTDENIIEEDISKEDSNNNIFYCLKENNQIPQFFSAESGMCELEPITDFTEPVVEGNFKEVIPSEDWGVHLLLDDFDSFDIIAFGESLGPLKEYKTTPFDYNHEKNIIAIILDELIADVANKINTRSEMMHE